MGFFIFNQPIVSANMEKFFNQYKWNNRIVLLLVDSDSSELWMQQKEMRSKNPVGIEQRDLVVLIPSKNKVFDGIAGFEFHKWFNQKNANFF